MISDTSLGRTRLVQSQRRNPIVITASSQEVPGRFFSHIQKVLQNRVQLYLDEQ